jgi:8-oxo-dGTP diphosphatase
MKPNVRITAIIFYEGKLITVKHENKKFGEYYLLPGGGWEHEESIEECVIREVKEETGLDVVIDYLAYYKSVYTDTEDTLDLIFKCKILGGILENNDPDGKVKSIELINSEEELKKLNFHPKQLKKIIFKKNIKKKAESIGKAKYPE